jgi:PTH1 family peptidyl-tRNA hydrolase
VALVVGLGNPGPEFASTRHNLGFRVVEQLVARWGAESLGMVCQAELFQSRGIALARPLTFMNRSGAAVVCLVERFGVDPAQVLVIYDDVDLPLGSLRLRPAGSAGGHRGMASVLQALKTDRVPRLRLGIGRPPEGVEVREFVLSPFQPGELDRVAQLVSRGVEAVELWCELGTERVMSRVNVRAVPEDPTG